LHNPIFRNLLLANLASDVGSFMQAVGAAWLMVSLGAGPMTVALIQTASTLPFFVLALPAGALGDIVDRRRLILATEYWMLGAATALALASVLGALSPWLLLALTFLLSAGDALEAPSWRALLPELVDREDLGAASALNGIEFNLARAAGPALGGLLIAAAGVSAAFALNALSFFAVIVVVTRWKRRVTRGSAPPETLGGATVAALRYVRHSPAIRTLLVRTGGVMFFAAALMAMLPVVARRISGSSLGYGVLLASFGTGSVLGAVALPRLRARVSTENILSVALSALGVSLLATGWLHSLLALSPAMLVGGAGWMVFIAVLNTMVQQLAPGWVRARVLAVSLLVFQGSLALGSVVWGYVAERTDFKAALLLAGAGTVAALSLRFLAPLPDVDVDLSAWNHWRTPTLAGDLEPALEDGPVLVTVEYRVNPERAQAFVQAAHRLGRLRRRDGASRWGIYRDTGAPDRYIETFIVNSWAEHLRQHERPVAADRLVEESTHVLARERPVVRHFLYARKNDELSRAAQGKRGGPPADLTAQQAPARSET
jgi:MFS family permease